MDTVDITLIHSPLSQGRKEKFINFATTLFRVTTHLEAKYTVKLGYDMLKPALRLFSLTWNTNIKCVKGFSAITSSNRRTSPKISDVSRNSIAKQFLICPAVTKLDMKPKISHAFMQRLFSPVNHKTRSLGFHE